MKPSPNWTSSAAATWSMLPGISSSLRTATSKERWGLADAVTVYLKKHRQETEAHLL